MFLSIFQLGIKSILIIYQFILITVDSLYVVSQGEQEKVQDIESYNL